MPEITSVEAIRAKLREFDERVGGAIVAAKTLARVKTDAEKLLNGIRGIANNGEQSLQKAEAARMQLQDLQRNWETLKQQMLDGLAETREAQGTALTELKAAMGALDTKVVEAEQHLTARNKASLSGQAELLTRLEESTRQHAEMAAKAQAAVGKTRRQLDDLVSSVKEELGAEVHGRLTKAEELLASEAERVERYLKGEETALRETVTASSERNERVLREEMEGFKSTMQQRLTEHQQAIDRQITEFLNKQNALVQNLAQQIDSFNRVAQTQTVELKGTSTRLDEISSTLDAHRVTTVSEFTTIHAALIELRNLTTELNVKVSAQDITITALQRETLETGQLLNQTLDKLKQVPLLGGRFK